MHDAKPATLTRTSRLQHRIHAQVVRRRQLVEQLDGVQLGLQPRHRKGVSRQTTATNAQRTSRFSNRWAHMDS